MKHTIVVEGGDLGAHIAAAVARKRGMTDVRMYRRRDGWAVSAEGEKGERGAWVKDCRRSGLTVLPAPWEQRALTKSEARRVAIQTGEE